MHVADGVDAGRRGAKMLVDFESAALVGSRPIGRQAESVGVRESRPTATSTRSHSCRFRALRR